MLKNTGPQEAKNAAHAASGKHEEIRIYVPREVANRFRRIAKVSGVPAHELFVEMIEAYSHGLDL
jgi:hypothetical protein